MSRSFEIEPTDDGWKLTLYEDGEEAGGGQGMNTDDDYEWLMEIGHQFCGD